MIVDHQSAIHFVLSLKFALDASVNRQWHTWQEGSWIIQDQKVVPAERVAVEASGVKEGSRRVVVLVE